MSNAKQAILDALTELIATTPLENITVGDLMRKADVSRSTYYYHFSSLEDACNQLVESAVQPICALLTPSPNTTSHASMTDILVNRNLEIFSYYKDHQNLYQALLWSDLRDEFVFRYVEGIKQCAHGNYDMYYNTDIAIEANQASDFWEYQVSASAYIHFSILETWASRDFKDSPENVDAFMNGISYANPENTALYNKTNRSQARRNAKTKSR